MQLGHRHRQARMRLASPPLALLLSLPNLEVTPCCLTTRLSSSHLSRLSHVSHVPHLISSSRPPSGKGERSPATYPLLLQTSELKTGGEEERKAAWCHFQIRE